MRTKKLLAALLSSAMVLGTMAVPALAVNNAAKIGTTEYATLEAAFAAAEDGNTITVLADCAGNGIKAPEGKFNTTGLTVDFGNHTYTVDGTTVGSAGTETNGFQLLKNNKITFKNGTITSTKAKILIQNYSNLTLDGMTLTLDNENYTSAYTLSNNNGDVVIDDTTINANPAGGFAFDVCRYASYPSVNVTVTGESVIDGNVEVSASGNDAKEGFGLNFVSGTLTGTVVMDSSAVAAMAATPDKVTVPTAQIGTTVYATLEAAVAAANNASGAPTIKLLADCDTGAATITAPLALTKAGTTLDLNGKSITVINNFSFVLGADNITVKNGNIYSADNSAKRTGYNSYILVIGGQGAGDSITGVKVTGVTMHGGVSVGGSSDAAYKGIANNTVIESCDVTSGDYYAVVAQNKSNVTIKSGTYRSNKTEVHSGKGQLSPGVLHAAFKNSDGPEGYITVSGGTFNGVISSKNVNWISITGGVFSSDPQTYVAPGYAAVPSGNGYNVSKAQISNTTQLNSALSAATSDKPVTIKSAVKSGTYEQVTAKTTDNNTSESATFKITATGAYEFTKTIDLSEIYNTANYSGGILCGLVITEIPSDVTLTIE